MSTAITILQDTHAVWLFKWTEDEAISQTNFNFSKMSVNIKNILKCIPNNKPLFPRMCLLVQKPNCKIPIAEIKKGIL